MIKLLLVLKIIFIFYVLYVRNIHTKSTTLRLVHLIFRHGNRNPERITMWKENRYSDESYYPGGFGRLTEDGKSRAYRLGLFFREMYGDFLGDTWNSNLMNVQSTDFDRAKMSALLMLDGLFPHKCSNTSSEEEEEEQLWQHIPLTYYATNNDSVLPSVAILRDLEFKKEFEQVVNSPEIAEYLSSRYGEVMKSLNKYTGAPTNDYVKALLYSDALEVQVDLGFPLPDWAAEIFPYPLLDLKLEWFYLIANTTKQRQLLAGHLLGKILRDSQGIADGTVSKKLFVYSGHDVNVAGILLLLEAYRFTVTPPYSSTVILEVHEIEGVFGLQLYYYDFVSPIPKALNVRGCNHFCPIDKFKALVEDLLP